MKRIVVTLLLAASGLAGADTCQVQTQAQAIAYPAVSHQQQAAKKVVAQEELFFQKFLAVQLLEVPTYSAVYVPAPPTVYQAPAQQSSGSSELREILEVLKSFDARLRRLEGQNPVVPTAPPAQPQIPPMPKIPETGATGKPDALTLLATRCAACHEAGVSGDRAGGVTLFKGDPPVLTAAARWREKMASAVEKGTMPEMDSAYTLTSVEKSVLVDYLRSML